MEVYGWQPISDEIRDYGTPRQSLAFDEHTPPNPNAPYAVAKLAVEKYLEYAHRALNLPFTAIRQTNSYGRTDNDFFVTEQIITQMILNSDVVNLGYAEPFRNFIWIDDLLEAWIRVIENPNQCNQGKIYTVGPDNPIKISDYANKIAAMIGWKGNIQWNTKPKRPGEIYWLNSGTTAISRDLGWEPQIDLDIGLARTIDIWRRKLDK
jgi:UDP-glucose 4-epimerase